MRFRLVRYFTVASVGIFAGVAIAMVWFAREQASFLENIQRQEIEFVKKAQAEFVRQQETAALKDLLAVHETGNVTLTRLFSNTLWTSAFAPYVAKGEQLPIDQCQAIALVTGPNGKPAEPPERKACFAEVGARLRALPEFSALDAKVFEMMVKTNVVKIKVFDLRGVTLYSSEHAQMGEDKSGNAGWQGAVKGVAKSELSYRDKFSAFEGIIEKRDVISSYLPVYGLGDQIVGIFEVYSDTTPLLAQIRKTSAAMAATARSNEAQMEQVSAQNVEQVGAMSTLGIAIVAGLLLLLFVALFLIVRRAQSIIVKQDLDREHDQQQMAQNEKMASLGQMVAGVAHQLNTPLAFSRSNITMVMDALKGYEAPLKVAHAVARAAQGTPGDVLTLNIASSRAQLEAIDDDGGDVPMLTQMLSDTLQGIDQMHEMVNNLREFTRLDRAKIAQFDINKGLRTVAYIARSAIPNRVELVEDFGSVPLVECNPSQLNQVFLNLINNAAQAIPGDGKVTVRSRVEGGLVRVDIADTGTGIPADVQPHIFETYYTTKPAGEGTGLGLPIVKSIVKEHGGDVTFKTEVGAGTVFSVFLPVKQGHELVGAA